MAKRILQGTPDQRTRLFPDALGDGALEEQRRDIHRVSAPCLSACFHQFKEIGIKADPY